MNEELEKSIPALQDKLFSVFDSLAQKAGIAVDHFWPIFVKQQMVESIALLAITLFFGLVALVLYFIAYKIYKKYGAENPQFSIPTVVASIICVGNFIAIGTKFDQVITGLFNPEYGAIQSLIKMVQ